jgi:hypothetical protein
VKRENRLKPVHTFLPKIVDFVPKLCVKNWSQHFLTRINFLQKNIVKIDEKCEHWTQYKNIVFRLPSIEAKN